MKILSILSFLIVVTSMQAWGQAEGELALICRIEIEERDDHFKLKLFIKNSTDQDIVVVSGRGGVGKQVTPSLYCAHHHVAPANFRGYPRRSMRPVPLTIPAGSEILYDAYVVGYPKGSSGNQKLVAQIRFPDASDIKKEYKLKAEADLKIP